MGHIAEQTDPFHSLEQLAEDAKHSVDNTFGWFTSIFAESCQVDRKQGRAPQPPAEICLPRGSHQPYRDGVYDLNKKRELPAAIVAPLAFSTVKPSHLKDTQTQAEDHSRKGQLRQQRDSFMAVEQVTRQNMDAMSVLKDDNGTAHASSSLLADHGGTGKERQAARSHPVTSLHAEMQRSALIETYNRSRRGSSQTDGVSSQKGGDRQEPSAEQDVLSGDGATAEMSARSKLRRRTSFFGPGGFEGGRKSILESLGGSQSNIRRASLSEIMTTGATRREMLMSKSARAM